ncbi:MAG: VWA domain-containing protein [Flavobacteriales bacterium]|nr:VWA domain-containing protein [Flavobacteriales bacterium]
MARKEINVFSIAFLDLLSGALAAVIILFVIVPKMSAEEEKLIKALGGMDVTVTTIADLLDKAKGAIPIDYYDSLVKSIGIMKQEIDTLGEIVDFYKQHKDWMDGCELSLDDTCLIDYTEYYTWMSECDYSPSDDCPPEIAAVISSGMEFRGNHIVFVLDISGSMNSEGRLEAVQASLKLLLHTMDDNVHVDLVFYPDIPNDTTFGSVFHSLTQLSVRSRNRLYNKIYKISATGGTPTRAVMSHVLDKYSYATDIVLLSDGDPYVYPNGIGNGSEDEDIDDLIRTLTNKNAGKRAINTIVVGKGSGVLDGFMSSLANKNDGFYLELRKTN